MRKNKLLICTISAMIITASGCGSRKDTLEDTITVVDATDENVSDKAELDTTLAVEENHNETEQTTAATTEATEQTVTEIGDVEETEENTNPVSTETSKKQTTDNKKNPVKQTTTKNNKQTNSATTSKKNPVKEEQTTVNEEQQAIKEIKEKQVLAKAKIKKLMPSIVKSSMTELQKVIAIHDWIVINMDYAYNDYKNGTIMKDAHTAYGGLENGYVVCNGYVELFSYMTAEVGIESKQISGYGNLGTGDQHHRWSQVKIDGKWYNLDLTWDDPTWNGKEHDDNLHNSYHYFLISDTEFYKTHRVYKDDEYYTEKPSICTSSISIPDIIDASVTKRAVYFTDEKDKARFKKDVENIAKTDIKYFAVYCMNGDAIENKRAINSVVAKTLKTYSDEGSELPSEGYQMLFYERKDDMLVASNESECTDMIKKAIKAKEKGTIYRMRCVNAIFADDKANYNGDIYYNKENARCEANLYKWTAKAGLDQVFGCISGDGYTEIIFGDYNDGRKVLVAYDADNALTKIKNYLDTLNDPTKADIRLICVNEKQMILASYLQQYGYKTEYDIGFLTEEDLGESVYMIIGIKVEKTNRCEDFQSLKFYIEKCKEENKFAKVFYYDSKITKDNYEQYMRELYKDIGSGTIIYDTYYIKDGVVYIE